MKPYAFPTGKDPAFLFGCGRFRMEEHLLENCAEEIVWGQTPLPDTITSRFPHGVLPSPHR